MVVNINEKFYFKLCTVINNVPKSPLRFKRGMETITFYGKLSSSLSVFSIETNGYPIFKSKDMSLHIDDLVRLNVISNMFNSDDIKEWFNIEKFDIIKPSDFYKISNEELKSIDINKNNFEDKEYRIGKLKII
jgi:hypothetical protein